MHANTIFVTIAFVAAIFPSAPSMAGDMRAVLDPGGNFVVQNASSNALLQVQSGGNVGIGTASPVGALHIKRDGGTLYLHAASSAGGSDLTWLNEGGGAMWAFSMRPGGRDLELYRNGGAGGPVLSFGRSTGNVGIGTTTPQTKLDVAGNALFSTYGEYGTPTLSLPLGQQYIRLGDRGALQSWPGEGLVGTFLLHNALHQGSIGWKNVANAGYSMLHAGTGSVMFYTGGSPGAAETIFAPALRMILDANGNLGIGTATPQATLHVNGNARVDGTQTVRVLSITGGADVAEPFAVDGVDIPAGAVVVIDDENPGRLKLSDRACDRRVAGIVSGAGGVNPGLTLSQQGLTEGGRNVALTGRVYALADAENGPIQPGDLLTTSPTPGHAMKVTDYQQAQGAILGKAMSRMESGRGLVLVLVTLQ